MKRRLASLAQPMATCLALVLLLLTPASCSKDQAPVAPDHVINGSKSPPSATATLAPSQGVVVLKAGAWISTFCSANNMVLVNTLPMAAMPPDYLNTMYYLLRTADGSNFADHTGFASFQDQVDWYSLNDDVRLVEDDIVSPDRDGLTFDDESTPRRTVYEYLEQPAFAQVGLLEARTVADGNSTTEIALLDTGVDMAHPLFQSPLANIVSGGNYTVMPPIGGANEASGNSSDDDGDAYIDDGQGHGTFVAGVVYTAARQAKIRVYKVLNDEGLGTTFGLAKAIRAAVIANVDVISLSAGTFDDNEMLHHVIAEAVAQGIVVVVSAGNSNADMDAPGTVMQYPAAWEEVVTVSAVDDQDQKFAHANYGEVIDLVAPGVDVISAIPSAYLPHYYAQTSGTSAAVPWISGAIATVMEAKSVNAVQAYDKVYHDVDPIGGNGLGRGRLNMARAVDYVPPPPPDPPDW